MRPGVSLAYFLGSTNGFEKHLTLKKHFSLRQPLEIGIPSWQSSKDLEITTSRASSIPCVAIQGLYKAFEKCGFVGHITTKGCVDVDRRRKSVIIYLDKMCWSKTMNSLILVLPLDVFHGVKNGTSLNP